MLGDIAALRADDKRVPMNCHGGASRSGLVLRARLMREQGLLEREATQQVAAAWPRLSLWSGSFTQALHALARRSR